MNYQEFKLKYAGKGVDFDGYYGFQCMDLYQQYNKEVVGAPHIPADPAYKVWDENKYPTDFYTKIANTLTGVPQAGDVVIWASGVNGGYGHIAVFDSGDANNFVSFDQNWPVGTVCHLQSHNYNSVYGWLRPKVQAEPTITMTVKEADAIRLRRDELYNETVKLKEDIKILTNNYQEQLKQTEDLKTRLVDLQRVFDEYVASNPETGDTDLKAQLRAILYNTGFWWTKLNKIKTLIPK